MKRCEMCRKLSEPVFALERLAMAQALAYGHLIRPILNPALLRAQGRVRKSCIRKGNVQLGKGFTERDVSKKLGGVYV